MASSKLLGLSGLVLFFLSLPAFAQDCSPLTPSKPVNSEVANKTKANANILLKSLGSGDIENEFKGIQTDVLSKYPNADRVHIWDSFVYMLCTLLKSSTSLNDQQKLDRYQILVDKWQTDSARTAGGGITHHQRRVAQPSRSSSAEQGNRATQPGSTSIGSIHQESDGPQSPPVGINNGQIIFQGTPPPSK